MKKEIRVVSLEDNMLVESAVRGVAFAEYFTVVDGQAYIERIDSNVLLNQRDDLTRAGIDDSDIVFDTLDSEAQEAWRSLYIQAYDEKMHEILPSFNSDADKKKSASPWCISEIDSVDATNIDQIIAKAQADAVKHAPMIQKALSEV